MNPLHDVLVLTRNASPHELVPPPLRSSGATPRGPRSFAPPSDNAAGTPE